MRGPDQSKHCMLFATLVIQQDKCKVNTCYCLFPVFSEFGFFWVEWTLVEQVVYMCPCIRKFWVIRDFAALRATYFRCLGKKLFCSIPGKRHYRGHLTKEYTLWTETRPSGSENASIKIPIKPEFWG